MKPYLCGAIAGCTDAECKDWREAVKKVFPDAIDPMVRDYRGREDKFYQEIVELDKLDILRSDCLIVNYPKPSTGTDMEILFAWEQHKPIYVIVPEGYRVSPWLRYHSTKIVHSLRELLDATPYGHTTT